MGDFNINWQDKKSPATRELGTTVSIWGLKPQISGSTRLGLMNGVIKSSCIDNIFTNSGDIIQTKVLDWNFSDHLLVAVKRKRIKVKAKKVSFKGRSYRNYIKEDLQEELARANWEEFYESRDPVLCWEVIENRIRGFLNRVAPQKDFVVKEVREPWVTNEILEEIKDKDKALRDAK